MTCFFSPLAIGWDLIPSLSLTIIASPSSQGRASLLSSPGVATIPPPTLPASEPLRLDGAAAFAITRVPPVPDNFAPGGAQSAQLASLARSVQWVTLAARPEGDDLRISLEGECDNSTDARQLQSALEILRMFGRAGLDSPKTRQSMDPAALAMLQTLLSTAEVTQAAERVRILIEITPDVWHLSGPAKPQH